MNRPLPVTSHTVVMPKVNVGFLVLYMHIKTYQRLTDFVLVAGNFDLDNVCHYKKRIMLLFFILRMKSVTKERSMKLLSQQRDIGILAHQIIHVLNFTNWAISNGSSTALLYSKRLVSINTKPILFIFYSCRVDPGKQKYILNLCRKITVLTVHDL